MKLIKRLHAWSICTATSIDGTPCSRFRWHRGWHVCDDSDVIWTRY